MKRFCAGLVVLGLFAVAACNQNKDTNQPKGGAPPGKGGTFTMEDPKPITVKEGDTKDYTFTIDRKEDFNQPVTLTFKPPPGVTVEPDTKVIAPNEGKKNGKASTNVKLIIAKDAPVGEKQFTVIAKPEKGDAIEKALKMKIDKP